MAADGLTSVWPVEHIPDSAGLFLRVHVNDLITSGQLHPGSFRQRGKDGMSVDWDKYSTPEEAHLRAKDPASVGIVTLVAGKVRGIEGVDVIHRPLDHNRAHSLVVGMLEERPGMPAGVRKTMVRVRLFQQINNTWTINPIEL